MQSPSGRTACSPLHHITTSRLRKDSTGHYAAIAEAVDIPIVVYNVPGRTGSNINAETTLRMAEEIPNVVAVKEASGNVAQIMEILRSRPDDFAVYSGDDNLAFAVVSLGGDGIISVVANTVPGCSATWYGIVSRAIWRTQGSSTTNFCH